MSVSSPSTPWRLESGNKFTFEPTLKSHHYFLHLLKMLRCPLLLSLLSLVFLALLLLSSAGSVPIHASHTARAAASDEDILFLTGLPNPPSAAPIREEREASPTVPSPTAPIILPFTKNPHCTLNTANTTDSRVCGLRQMDLPGGQSGIKTWKPSRCRKFHCRCLATKEVHRTKRTIADNKTTLETHRYRIFECV